MASMYCPKCGMPNDSRVAFCGSCGYALQATGAVTFYPPQGQQSSPHPTNVPSPYPTGNMPSSPTYPANGTPPPPPYPTGNMPSSPTYTAVGAPPPPPYPTGNTPSSPTYPADGTQFPPAAYPKSESNLPPLQPQQPRQGKKGIIAILAVVVVVILVGAVVAGIFAYTSHNTASSKSGSSSATQGTTATPAATTNSSSATQGTTATPAATANSSSATPSITATPAVTANAYSAIQPGPGCDTNGGTWTPQDIGKITCGTQITINSSNSRGYLYLQLPNNQPFSSNNTIGITGGLNGYSDSVGNCVGLAEQGVKSGFLVEYCYDGRWYIYSISSTGAIVQTLAKNITSTRTSEQLSLALKGTSLSFTIDSEVHIINVSPLQPTKVAITYFAGGGGESVTVTNFSYTA